MSRVAKSPISLPAGVTAQLDASKLTVKGPKGQLSLEIDSSVAVEIDGNVVTVKPSNAEQANWALAGTTRSLANNMVQGVSQGFQRKLELVGVGYRAVAKGKVLSLTLGFSHPVEYQLPEGVTAETPSQTEVVLSSIDKQLLGQAAANIRSYRPPEPYKGKGVRYSDETVLRKEAKKK